MNPILNHNLELVRHRSDSDIIESQENIPQYYFSCDQNKFIKYENNVEFKNKIISVFFHIFLMSVFEILFYFYFIVDIEKQLFLEKLMTYNNNLNELYINNISPEQHALISTTMYNMFNDKMLTEIRNQYEHDMHQQQVLFNLLLKKAMIISSIVGALFLSSIIYGRKEIKLNWVLFENCLLFLFLGLYEYIFFNTIILKYNPITDGEIQFIFVCDFLKNFNIEC